MTDPTTWDFEDQEELELLQDLALSLIDYDSDYSVKLNLEEKKISIFYDEESLGFVAIEDGVYYWNPSNADELKFEYADDVIDSVVEHS